MSIQCITLAKANAGLVLAKPVIDDKGLTLCKAGTTLTDKLLARFNQMGVKLVTVESEETLSEQDVATERSKIRDRFAKVHGDPLLGPLESILLKGLENQGRS